MSWRVERVHLSIGANPRQQQQQTHHPACIMQRRSPDTATTIKFCHGMICDSLDLIVARAAAAFALAGAFS